MARLITLVVLLAYCLPSMATDVTLLAGYQFNSNFELATFDGQSPEASPATGSPGDDVGLDDGAAFSLAVDFVFERNKNQRIGFYISHAQTEFDDNAGLSDKDMDVTHTHFTAMSYYPEGKMEPFVLAGLGAGFFSPKDSSLKNVTKISAQLGAGTNYRLTENLLLRLDARWLMTFFNGSGSAFCDGGCAISVRSDLYSQLQTNVGLMVRF